MKVSLTLALLCLVLHSGVYAGEIELKMTLSKSAFFQDETIIAGINIVNMSTAAVSVPEPVEGANVWLEIRDSSGTYVSTRPINLSRGSSKGLTVLQPGSSSQLKIKFLASIKGPVIPVTSTSAVASAGERLRDRLGIINLRPGYYFLRAVYLSAPENWTYAITSNKEQIYVKRRE